MGWPAKSQTGLRNNNDSLRILLKTGMMNKRSWSTFCYIKQSPEDKEKGMETEGKKYIFFWGKKKKLCH